MVNLGISLVVQCLGIHLPIQVAWVQFLVREDPTCHGATKPMLCNYWSQHPRAHAQHQEKPPHWGAQALQLQRSSTAKKEKKKKVTLNLGDFLNDMRHIHHERKNQGNIWGGGAARQFTFKPPTLWGDFSIMAERPVPHQFPHHQQQFGFHPWTYSKWYEKKNLPTKNTLSRKVMFQKWRRNKNFPRKIRGEGVPHH